MLSQNIISLLRNPEVPDGILRDAVIEESGGQFDMANVYAIIGITGEYSDKKDWTVAAYLDKGQAELCCERMNKWLRDNKFHKDNESEGTISGWEVRGYTKNPDDPDFVCDYTGTNYVVLEIPLRLEE